jgi:TRAP transporter TAXI family solute receptor
MRRGKYYATLTIALGLFLIFLLAFTIYTSNRRVTLDFTSGQQGGAYPKLAEAIAELVHGQHRRIKIRVHPSDGSKQNAQRIAGDKARLALVQNDTDDDDDDSLRSLVPLHQGALHFLVRRDSGIKSLADLENHRIGVGLKTSGSHELVNALLNHFELDLSKIDIVPVRIQEGCDSLTQGDIDALLIVLSLKSPALDTLLSTGGIDLVKIGRHSGKGSVIDGFRLSYPFVEPYLIPRFAYTAPPWQSTRYSR